MNKEVMGAIARMEEVFERADEEYCYPNIYGDKIPYGDYAETAIPDSRVREDRDELVERLNQFYHYCAEAKRLDDFTFVFAAYCNYYIRKGFQIRLGVEDFEQRGDWFGEGEENRDYFSCIWKGILDRNYAWFEKALKIREGSAVPAMYLFIRHVAVFSQSISGEQSPDERQEEEMWRLYEILPPEYREYVMGQGNMHREVRNLAADDNLLSYINFCSVKEFLVSYVQECYLGSLEKLQLDPWRMKVEDAFITILEKFQLAQEPDYSSAYMLLTFLFEKLHYLSVNEDREGGEEAGFFEKLPLPGGREPRAYRNSYLNIPAVLSEKTTARFLLSRYDLFCKNRQLEEEIRKVTRLNQEKKDIMDHYAHSWKHISYPMTVKRAAEELSQTNVPLANRLFKAYNSERTLQGGLQILQCSISDQPSAMRDAFSQGFYCVGAVSGKPIQKILEESMDLVLFKVLMEEADGSRRISRCRANLQKKHSLEQLREDYTQSYIQRRLADESILAWFDRCVIPLEVSIDPMWQEIRIKEDEFADIQLSEMFVELFTNVLTHGRDWCRIHLAAGKGDMRVRISNAVGEEHHGTCKGLETLKKIVDKINWGTQIHGFDIESGDADTFAVEIAFDRKIMYRRGRY